MATGIDDVVVEQSLTRTDPEVVVEAVVEPVIAESHSKCHFGCIEKMTALVPVLEGNDGLHVRNGLFQIPRLPCHPVGVCAGAYPLERELRLVEYAFAGGIQLIDNFGVVSHGFVGHIHKQLMQFV